MEYRLGLVKKKSIYKVISINPLESLCIHNFIVKIRVTIYLWVNQTSSRRKIDNMPRN